MKLKYLSLFSGIAGFELGIGNKAECIGYSEIDKYAIQIYEKHFKHKNYGDITKIRWENVPNFELLVGGFPCQTFSIAGKRKGFEDTRGTLFFDIAKGLKVKQPNFVLLENVKGLMSHDDGRTLEIILETLQELGYYVNIEVYNSKDFGVPQNRERIFIICRHIKTLINIGQKESVNLLSPIIKEYLFQILLNNLIEVQKLQEIKSKDWVLGYLLCKEINQNQKLKDENIKGGIMIPMVGGLFQSEVNPWQNIDTWLRKNLADDLKELNKFTTLTAIKQIIESKTYTYSKMLQCILVVIVLLRNSSKDLWNEILLDLIVIKENTKYARINDKTEEIIISETGNAYISENIQANGQYFIIGHLRGTPRPKVFPIGENNKEFNEKKQRGVEIQTAQCLNARMHKMGRDDNYIKIEQLNQPKHSNDRVYSNKGLSPSLNTMQGGNRQPFVVASRGRNPSNSSDRTVGMPTEQRLEINKQGTSNTLTNVQKDNWVLRDSKIRRLTPIECERLQGFPDGWTEGVSDTQRYKTLGNAVTVNVIKEIIKKLLT